MRKLALFVMLSLALAAGCKSSGSKRLTGKWQGQKAEGVPENAQASANEFARKTRIVAQGNQITIVTPASSSSSTYTVDSEEPGKVVIRTERDKGPELFTFDASGKTMTWQLDSARTLTFAKDGK